MGDGSKPRKTKVMRIFKNIMEIMCEICETVAVCRARDKQSILTHIAYLLIVDWSQMESFFFSYYFFFRLAHLLFSTGLWKCVGKPCFRCICKTSGKQNSKSNQTFTLASDFEFRIIFSPNDNQFEWFTTEIYISSTFANWWVIVNTVIITFNLIPRAWIIIIKLWSTFSAKFSTLCDQQLC